MVAAPGGYGKSVLAAQFASEGTGECLWVAMNGCSPSPDDLPAVVAGAIQANRETASRTAGAACASTP